MPKNRRSPTTPFIYSESESEYFSPRYEPRPIRSVADVLNWEQDLRLEYFGSKKVANRDRNAGTRLQEIWFRGTWKHFPLLPGIYRQDITDLIKKDREDYWMFDGDLDECVPRLNQAKEEYKRLNFEREMILTFERESRPLLEYEAEQELYFVARHYGLPSRLLDWSISPLVALFMCVFREPTRVPRGESLKGEKQAETNKDKEDEDGVIHAMDPENLEPHGYICQQYDDKVEDAVEIITTWEDPCERNYKEHAILAIRPHTLAGRIDRQHSRFTLHSYGAKPQRNVTLRSFRVPKECKEPIRGQLERIGVTEFSVYYTLDRLVSDIRDRFSKFKLQIANNIAKP
jgi:hypothetical protein